MPLLLAIYQSICCIFLPVFGSWVLDKYNIITMHLPILPLYCYLMFHPFLQQKNVFLPMDTYFSGNKNIGHRLSASPKTLVFPSFCLFSCFSTFSVFWHEKHWKGRFPPVFGAHSTQTLFKIFNQYCLLLEVWYFHTHKTSLTTTLFTSNGQLSCPILDILALNQHCSKTLCGEFSKPRACTALAVNKHI